MRRRDFLALGTAAAVGSPLQAFAQQTGMKRLAFVNSLSASDPAIPPFVAAMKEGLASQGWVEGKNIVIDIRFAVDAPEKAPPVIKELLDLKPDVFILVGNNALADLEARTAAIPVIIAPSSSNILATIVYNFSRPSGNITGFPNNDPGSLGKILQLLKELVPSLARVGSLYLPNDPNIPVTTINQFMSSAKDLGLEPVVLNVATASDIEPTLAKFAAVPNSGHAYALTASFFLNNHAIETAALIKYRVPHVYGHLVYGSEGVLNYYVDTFDIERRAGAYAGLILNGTPVSELPVQYPTKWTLVVNQKVAKQIGVTVPESILLRADQVVS